MPLFIMGIVKTKDNWKLGYTLPQFGLDVCELYLCEYHKCCLLR